MRKALPLLTLIVLIMACQSAQNPNANLNDNAVRNQNPNEIAKEPPPCDKSDTGKTVQEVIVATDPDYLPQSIGDININHEKSAVWCIRNSSGKDIRVVIFNLRAALDPNDINPFGTGKFKENTFSSKKIKKDDTVYLKTTLPNKARWGTYRYDIVLTDDDGEILDFLDPQVVISENKSDTKSDTGVRNSNTANKNKK